MNLYRNSMKSHFLLKININMIKSQIDFLPLDILFHLITHQSTVNPFPIHERPTNSHQLLLSLSSVENPQKILLSLSEEEKQLLSNEILKYLYHKNRKAYEQYSNILPKKAIYHLIEFAMKDEDLSDFMKNWFMQVYVKEPDEEGFLLLKTYLQRIKREKIQDLREKYVKLYIKKQSNKYNFILLKTLQLFRFAQNSWTFTSIINELKNNLYECMCDFETKGATTLAINIYGTMLKDIDKFTQYVQAFIDVYSILDSYGTHLIKDVWHNFYYLCQKAQTEQTIIFTPSMLLHCLLNKVEKHTNNNITKYCIQSLLTNPQSISLFEQVPETVYGSLVQTLNSGVHYHDCTLFHNDSKMYKYIRTFYSNFYSTLQNPALTVHIKKLIDSIHKYINFEHSVLSYMGIFHEVSGYSCDKADLLKLFEIVKKFYNRFTMRKRVHLVRYFFKLLNNAFIKNIELQWMIQSFFAFLPVEIFNLFTTFEFMSLYKNEGIEKLLQESDLNLKQKLLLEHIAQGKIDEKNSPKHKLLIEKIALLSKSFYVQIVEYEDFIQNLFYLHSIQLNKPYELASQLFENILYILSICLQKIEHISQEKVSAIIEYTIKRGIKVSRKNSKQSTALAKFIEYCLEKTKTENAQKWILALLSTLKYKLQYTQQYEALEQVLYSLWAQTNDIKNKKILIRFKVVLFCLLSHDPAFLKKQTQIQQNFQEICECYDFEHYEELYRFASIIVNNFDGKNEQQICKILSDVIDGMLHTLDYGIHKKQVVSTAQCVVQIMFKSKFSQSSCDLFIHLMDIGERYWGFQRQLTFSTLHKLKVDQITNGFVDILLKMVCIEEYRGEDSAILLKKPENQEIYEKNILHTDSDYDGTTLRFAVLDWTVHRIQNIQKEEVQYFLKAFDTCLQICSQQHLKEKMFLTGTHKQKLKLWQFMLTMPDFLILYHSDCQGIVSSCIKMMGQNNLLEVRHYAEIFLMKMIEKGENKLDYDLVCTEVSRKLEQIVGQANLGKNISYMVVGGLLLSKHYQKQLYTTLLTYICSHIAYFRGLSQYFCFSKMPEQSNPYLEILHKQYLNDSDAIKLSKLLHKILEEYKSLTKNWNIYEHILCQKATLNGQVVYEHYYVQQLKKISQKLIKQNKNEDGFMPYRDIWKKLVVSGDEKNIKQQANETFQRKIDPSLDSIYNFEPVSVEKKESQLKILVISHKKIALYGHLARVGEILGIQNLCIPSIKITQADDFRNVSCTAEKWLSITEHNYIGDFMHEEKKKQKLKKAKKVVEKPKTKEKLLLLINEAILEGYKLFVIKKGKGSKSPQNLNISKKSLLLLDQMNLFEEELEVLKPTSVSSGPFFSTHVEATIFMWEYFKEYIIS